MAQIRHIAISYKTEDCEAIADFYKTVFGMTELSRRVDENDPNVKFICLTDGHLDLSLVPSFVGYPEGINHIGFQVDNIDETRTKAIANGAKPGDNMAHGRNGGDYVLDPSGVRLDLDDRGWDSDTLRRVHNKRGGTYVPDDGA